MLIVAAVAVFVSWQLYDRLAEGVVAIKTPRGTLRVHTARTPEARGRGLSNRDAPDFDGLLLQWDDPGAHPIWMAEMRFPLDLLWLDASGRVLAVIPHAPACANAPCPQYLPAGTDAAKAVLELRAGQATQHGIAVGTQLEIRPDP
jgi:uncharacterized membrane protein (UPF0127 family)